MPVLGFLGRLSERLGQYRPRVVLVDDQPFPCFGTFTSAAYYAQATGVKTTTYLLQGMPEVKNFKDGRWIPHLSIGWGP